MTSIYLSVYVIIHYFLTIYTCSLFRAFLRTCRITFLIQQENLSHLLRIYHDILKINLLSSDIKKKKKDYKLSGCDEKLRK